MTVYLYALSAALWFALSWSEAIAGQLGYGAFHVTLGVVWAVLACVHAHIDD